MLPLCLQTNETPDPVLVLFQVDKLSVAECVKQAEECNALRYTFAECKRGQVNMRTRIQGNKGY